MPASSSERPSRTSEQFASQVNRMFDRIAGQYDALNSVMTVGLHHRWRQRAAARAQLTEGGSALDVCTGTGDLALAFDRAAGRRTKVIAADFCQPMLDIGREKAARAGAADRVTFLTADTESLPLPSETFQIVSVAFGLRNVADTDRGLAEMVRVAAPGGRVAVLEFSTPTWQPFKAIYGWYFRNVLPRIGQFFARNSSAAYEYLPESVVQFPQGEALAARMRAAGLESVRCYPLTFGVASLYVGTKSTETADGRR